MAEKNEAEDGSSISLKSPCHTLGLFDWPAAGSRFARPRKSAAAAAVTPSTQGGNEHQIESLQQTNYSWCILRCFIIYPWPMDG